jgi:uncharacterized phage infection (PIP) family protein YhgE
MTEVAGGIYSVDLLADWGLGSYVISCADPVASDRMVVEIVQAGANSIGELVDSLGAIESQITNVTSLVESISDPNSGLSAGLSQIERAISQVESAIDSAAAGEVVDTSGAEAIANLVGELEALGSSVRGDLEMVASQVELIMGEASDASTAARGARSAAQNTVTMVRELRDIFTTGDSSFEEASKKVDQIRQMVQQSNEAVAKLPETLGTSSLQSDLRMIADQIVDMARMQGYEYEILLEEQEAKAAAGGGGAGEGEGEGEGDQDPDEDEIKTLNQNMNEVRTALTFMQKLLDDQINEPVVQESWLGAE